MAKYWDCSRATQVPNQLIDNVTDLGSWSPACCWKIAVRFLLAALQMAVSAATSSHDSELNIYFLYLSHKLGKHGICCQPSHLSIRVSDAKNGALASASYEPSSPCLYLLFVNKPLNYRLKTPGMSYRCKLHGRKAYS